MGKLKHIPNQIAMRKHWGSEIDYSKALGCRLTDEEKLEHIASVRENPLYKDLMKNPPCERREKKKGERGTMLDLLSDAFLRGYEGLSNHYVEGSRGFIGWVAGYDLKSREKGGKNQCPTEG